MDASEAKLIEAGQPEAAVCGDAMTSVRTEDSL